MSGIEIFDFKKVIVDFLKSLKGERKNGVVFTERSQNMVASTQQQTASHLQEEPSSGYDRPPGSTI